MTTKTRASTVLTDYKKEELITALKDALKRREAMIGTFEENLAKWRKNSVKEFTEWVKSYDPEISKHYGHNLDKFAPPRLEQACQDFRIKGLHTLIARIGLVSGDVIRLRADDVIWSYIGEGACE